MSQPRIVFVTDDSDRGGVAQYNHSLLLALAREGYRVVCLQPRSTSPIVAEQREAGIEHRWLPYDPTRDFAASFADMATPHRVFAEVRPDLVFFSDCCPVSNLGGRNAALAMKLPFIVVVGFVGEYLAREAAPYLPLVARHFAAARAVIAVSQENRSLLESRFGLAPGKGQVIHYGRPPSFFAPAVPERRRRLREGLGVPAEAVVGLTVARFAPVKGYHHQLAAIEALDRRGQLGAAHFIWLGDGEERARIEREIRRGGWESRIRTPGHVWNTPEWYDAADYFVLSSELEGMPLAIMEAMAKGLPVVATAVSGIPEELDGAGRLLPDPKIDPAATRKALADTIAQWTRDPESRAAAGAASRTRAAAFTEERMLTQTLEAVRGALAGPPAALRQIFPKRAPTAASAASANATNSI